MRIAKPALPVGLGPYGNAGRTLRLGLDRSIYQVDREHRARCIFDDAMRDRTELAPRAMYAEPSADDQVCIDVAGKRDDLFVRLAGANVKSCSPARLVADDVQRISGENTEAVFGSFDVSVAVAFDHVDEVNVWSGMSRRLIECVFEDDLGILGQVERNN